MKTFEKHLSRGVEQMVPDDGFDRIVQAISSDKERRMSMNTNVTTIETARKNHKQQALRWIGGIAAAVLLVAAGTFGGVYYSSNVTVDSVVSIDVNPSITLTTNRQEKVLEVKAENEDAVGILDDMDLKNVDLKVAVNALIGSMVQKGYLAAEDNEILVSVQNDNEKRAKHIRNVVLADIQSSLKSNRVSASVLNQTVTEENTKAENFAKEHNISLGKANFVLKLAAKASSLNAAELAKMSIRDIAKLVTEQQIDLRGVVNYDEDDSVWENIHEAIEDENTPQPNEAKVTLAQAKAAALVHAKLNESDVTFVKAKLERDDGKLYYDVEFYANNKEYDYEIDAVSGKVIEYDQEYEPQPNKTPSSITASTTANKNYITAEQAKAAALAHAKLNESDVTFVKANLDYDDGRAVYDVEFYVGNKEYDYEIDAVSGKVREYDYDYENDRVTVSTTKKTTGKTTMKDTASYISAAKAKEIALKHAGVTAGSATFVKAERDRDDGRVVYEVEFYDGIFEYDYEIDALSGKVLEYDKERDD